ncbi:hypothetical protein, partial [Phocaeicola plebeius]|uniref:hypothetical protein n=1 Tax=Phocaeicola plebeius TaxID=310297 RepID=UPI00356A47FF
TFVNLKSNTMKNTVQKYLFYLKQQNQRLQKNVLQHTLTKTYLPIKSLNKYSLNLKKNKNETALSYYLSQHPITFV